jgi:hypothetical protein
MRLLTALIATTILFLTGNEARAGYQFVFANTSGVVQTNFNIDYGVQTYVDIRIYLVATGTADINTLRTDGLKSYGVQLNYSGVNARVLSDADITSNAAFDDADSTSTTTTSASINDYIGIASPSVKAGPTEDRILLATFRFTGIADGVQANVTIDPDPTLGSDDTVTGGNVVLDALIANSSATITVTNVPEPGTIVLGSLLAAGIGGGALRRRRQQTAATV